MAKKDPLLAALRKSKMPLERLVHAWVEDVLERPVGELFDTEELTRTIAGGIRGVARDRNNEKWLREQIAASLEEIQHVSTRGKLANKLPKKVVNSARDLLAQPFVFDEDLAVELLDHPAVHAMIREVLQASLLEFAKSITEMFPGGRVVTGLVGRAKGIASAAVGGAGSQLQRQVNEFVEDALSPSLDIAAGRLANDDAAEELADWRGHLLDVIVDQPVRDLVGTLDQVDPDELAGALAGMLRGLGEWKQLEATIAAALDAALERAEDRSVRDFLASTSLEKEGRAALEKQLVDLMWPFVHSEAFAAWLESLR